MLIHIVTQYALSTKWKLSDFGIQQSTVSQFSLWKLSRWNMQIDLNVKVEPRSTFTFTRGLSYITSILIYAREAC